MQLLLRFPLTLFLLLVVSSSSLFGVVDGSAPIGAATTTGTTGAVRIFGSSPLPGSSSHAKNLRGEGGAGKGAEQFLSNNSKEAMPPHHQQQASNGDPLPMNRNHRELGVISDVISIFANFFKSLLGVIF
jgi:hypothetical protein